jgi:hypothetical protein
MRQFIRLFLTHLAAWWSPVLGPFAQGSQVVRDRISAASRWILNPFLDLQTKTVVYGFVGIFLVTMLGTGVWKTWEAIAANDKEARSCSTGFFVAQKLSRQPTVFGAFHTAYPIYQVVTPEDRERMLHQIALTHRPDTPHDMQVQAQILWEEIMNSGPIFPNPKPTAVTPTAASRPREVRIVSSIRSARAVITRP